MSESAGKSAAPLWAITSYFNPRHYRRRLENYRTFRSRLNVPLITVEHSLDGTFDCRPGDADILVQLRGRDVMWHKERLLNLALQKVPANCSKIAWLDCDVIFQQADWATLTGEALNEFPVVQPFQDVCELARNISADQPEHPDNLRIGRSFAYGVATGTVDAGMLGENMRLKGWNSGLAWAARREVLDHGFYDACIMGSGNRAILCAELGRFDFGRQYNHMNDRWAEHYLAWARPHFDRVRGQVGFVKGTLLHLWHGNLKDRNYADRHREFSRFQFDPTSDIAADENGCWRWNSNKPEMHQFVRDYFGSRKEDG